MEAQTTGKLLNQLRYTLNFSKLQTQITPSSLRHAQQLSPVLTTTVIVLQTTERTQ